MLETASNSAGLCSHYRQKFRGVQDSCWGITILVLYFLYLSLVKGMLSIFDCTLNSDGVWILDADPSVRCYQVLLS